MTRSGILLVLISAGGILGLEKTIDSTDSSQHLEILSGFRLAIYDDYLRIKLDLSKLFPVITSAVGSRQDHHDDDKKQSGPFQRFGSMIVMIPLIMQMLSVPGAIASIKMSLLKSLVVAKLAILTMIFNILRNQRSSEVVVVHQPLPPPQHHDHYYPHFHEEYEDDDKGWFG